jgi:hypothetical protein
MGRLFSHTLPTLPANATPRFPKKRLTMTDFVTPFRQNRATKPRFFTCAWRDGVGVFQNPDKPGVICKG